MGRPDFFILGAQRAGTSSLAIYFFNHPSVVPPTCTRSIKASVDTGAYVLVGEELAFIGKFVGPQGFEIWNVGDQTKEPSYFSRFHHVITLDDYFSFFDNNENGKMGFDASPEYFDMVGVETRVKEACPDAKFIVLLRDPVKRAWSHYWHEVNFNKIEKLPFEEAIHRSPHCYCSQFFFAYLSRGMYANHLERWFSVFPRDRFRIYIMEEFYADTDGHFIDVQHWLGLEPIIHLEEYPRHSTLPEDYPEMPKEYEEPLREFYAPFNERLKALLGREELPW